MAIGGDILGVAFWAFLIFFEIKKGQRKCLFEPFLFEKMNSRIEKAAAFFGLALGFFDLGFFRLKKEKVRASGFFAAFGQKLARSVGSAF